MASPSTHNTQNPQPLEQIVMISQGVVSHCGSRGFLIKRRETKFHKMEVLLTSKSNSGAKKLPEECLLKTMASPSTRNAQKPVTIRADCDHIVHYEDRFHTMVPLVFLILIFCSL